MKILVSVLFKSSFKMFAFILNAFFFTSFCPFFLITFSTGFCREAEMDFQHLAGPRNVSVDLKYDVQCL